MIQPVWAITGRPGIGKSKLINYTVSSLSESGYKLGGILKRNIKINGKRTGFQIVDISTGKTATLATINGKLGPRFGKYRINLTDLSNVGITAINSAREYSDIIICDEIGPMELYSLDFCESIELLLNCNKPFICTVQSKFKHPIINKILNASNSKIVNLTKENRNDIKKPLLTEIINNLDDKIEHNRY